jgi:adenine/guanine phosphoribosyltransferase-like PRPP-binding protein
MVTAPSAPRCCICRAPTRLPYPLCFCCATVARQLRLPLVPVAAVADYRLGDPLHRCLRGYKDAPLAEARRVHVLRLQAMLGAWVADDLAAAHFGRRWDVVVTVPSSRRPAGAPVDAVVAGVPGTAGRLAPVLVRGPIPTDHLVASRWGFETADGIEPSWHRSHRVLVVDDTIITGARAQSAAAALRLHGAEVIGVLALGRVLPSTPVD